MAVYKLSEVLARTGVATSIQFTANDQIQVDMLNVGVDDVVVDTGGQNVTIRVANGSQYETITLTSISPLSFSGANLTFANGDRFFAGTERGDTIEGTSGNDYIVTNTGNDMLYGGAGSDVLDGGAGTDTMNGGAGNDIYLVGSATDRIIELPSGGTDTVRATVSAALAVNVENLTLMGEGHLSGIGNVLANVLTGNDGNNYLYGDAGNDSLFGGAGNDTLIGADGADLMAGGANDDVYYVDNVEDQIVEMMDGSGHDIVQSSVTFTLAANVEDLTLLGPANLGGTGNADANYIRGSGGANVLRGLAGNDTIHGDAGNDSIDGGAGNDLLRGDDGNDTMLGGDDNDLLLGGAGNDSIDGGAGNDVIYAEAGADDQLFGGTGNDSLYGNDGANVLDGGAGHDSMAGSNGNDSYLVDDAGDVVAENAGEGIDTVYSLLHTYTLGANIEAGGIGGAAAASLTGNALANTLTGGNGNDTLDGGLGADTLRGGMGNDTYRVNAAGDVIIETAADGGTDTVQSAISFALNTSGREQLENLALLGTGNLNATGNAKANVLTGNTGNNSLSGLDGNDRLSGGSGNDSLAGGNGNDTLVGGLGQDSLTGGAGNDFFDFNALDDSGSGTASGIARLAAATGPVRDVINDFARGQDRIDLSTIDANGATSANEAFTGFIGATASFTAAGQLRFDHGVLYANTDTDAAAEFAVQLVGVSALAMSDLVA